MGKKKKTTTTDAVGVTEEPIKNADHLSESDDDLPAAFTPAKATAEFKKEDLVFAKYRKYPYWPGVFYRYLHKKKKCKPKAYVYFFDDLTDLSENANNEKRIVPIPVCKMKRFTCRDRDELVRVGSTETRFQHGMEQAEYYMRKRALGKMGAFFEYTIEETYSSDDDDDIDMKENQGDGGDGIKETPEVSSDEEAAENNKITCVNTLNNTPESNINIINTPERCTRTMQNVIAWIKNNSRSILTEITSGKVPSQRHQTFHNGSQAEKDKLRWYSGFGKLDEESGQEIFDTLLSWFREEFRGSKYSAISYVSDVWLPEAYIHALSRTKNILYEDAEKEYLR